MVFPTDDRYILTNDTKLASKHINLDSLKGKTIEEGNKLIEGTKYNRVEVFLDNEGKIIKINPSTR
ncbi:hypothetical protein [Nostoc sp. C110]|uniref:hypothetical protein n=1 Tax=Nostoc sp. C110 TaxID=3349876 RepID=UPI00370D059D